MLKKKIKFEDFNGDQAEETHYFNLSKAELIEMEVSYGNVGLEKHIQALIDAEDNKGLIKEFKEIILMAYGHKSDDGRRFVKSDEIREAFAQTAAYQELFLQLATDDKAAAQFIIGIVPKDMSEEVEKLNLAAAKAQAKTTAELSKEQASTPEA